MGRKNKKASLSFDVCLRHSDKLGSWMFLSTDRPEISV